MNLIIEEVTSDEKLKIVSLLAEEIWHEHFTPIIGREQVLYMLDKFQSFDAMKRQRESEGYTYYLFKLDGEYVGYSGIAVHGDRLFLSKLYVKKSARGNKISRAAIEKYTGICREKGLRAIYLTVNKYNFAKDVYTTLGFKTIDSVKTDIGGGFYMDDYIMELEI
ncbi:MAG: GNAT family N-acetyltransferase [Clostridia bacterium]|nr:GNAT family N-acetyltransferase [Clostridia bacterium]